MCTIKNQKAFAIAGYILIVALIAGLASMVVFKSNDGPVEEAAESIIEHQLGLPPNSIDFSPDSNEG